MKQGVSATCKLKRIDYDFDTETGNLYIDACSVIHRDGCISIFEKLTSRVSVIRVWRVGGSESVPEAVYVRRGGAWFDAPAPHDRPAQVPA